MLEFNNKVKFLIINSRFNKSSIETDILFLFIIIFNLRQMLEFNNKVQFSIINWRFNKSKMKRGILFLLIFIFNLWQKLEFFNIISSKNKTFNLNTQIFTIFKRNIPPPLTMRSSVLMKSYAHLHCAVTSPPSIAGKNNLQGE